MAAKSKKPKEQYYILPMHIFNNEHLNGDGKLLLCHIYSFGSKGCWQSNSTLAKIFHTSPVTISRWISKIKKYVHIKSPKGYYRTIWVKSHPEVKESVKLYYKGKEIPKPDTSDLIKNDKEYNHQKQSQYCKSENGLNHKCYTTNNTTNKDTTKSTIERPSPLPAGGHAPAPLEYRNRERNDSISHFKNNFGYRKKHQLTNLNQEEKRNRVQQQRRALLATK